MKNPEEYFNKIPYNFEVKNVKEWICEQIEKAQKDAYNQAIQDMFEYQLLNGCLETNEDMVNNLKIK